jgi:hypothetical protein
MLTISCDNSSREFDLALQVKVLYTLNFSLLLGDFFQFSLVFFTPSLNIVERKGEVFCSRET